MKYSVINRVWWIVALATACSSADPQGTPDAGAGPTAAAGRALFEGRIPGGNSFTCDTCHALSEPAADLMRRPGHQLGDAVRRPNYKNGRVSSLREAVNTCLTEWIRLPEGWSETDSQWRSLQMYLESVAPTSAAPALSFQQVAPPADATGGDAMAGRTLFNTSCAICHGADASGTQRAPSLDGEVLMTTYADGTAAYIARRVRTSGPTTSPTYDDLTGGVMPFWSASRLDDDELKDLVAFVMANRPQVMPNPDAGTGGGADAGGGGGCGQTHSRVGAVATLSTRSHRVSGTATVVDDCTIRFDMFNFDGRGIEVRVYGGLNNNYRAGFAMGPNLLRSTAYANESFTVTLPSDKSLDDLDGVSIWCVPVGVSFGDGQFQ